jgi:1-acyl-sn-glycerol-3-phosphate acyltransferase
MKEPRKSIPRREKFIRFYKTFFGFILRLLTRPEATGMGNIPSTGACIVAMNHLGIADIPLLGICLTRDDVNGFVAKKHQKVFFFRWVVNAVKGIWIDRKHGDLKALRAARDLLRKGYILPISPEGTRSPTKALLEGKPGVAYLASTENVPIVPAAITGTEKVFRELSRFRRPRVTIRFGELFHLPPLDRSNRSSSLKQNTNEIMCRIAALLPPAYRGFYTKHPRLQELLDGNE